MPHPPTPLNLSNFSTSTPCFLFPPSLSPPAPPRATLKAIADKNKEALRYLPQGLTLDDLWVARENAPAAAAVAAAFAASPPKTIPAIVPAPASLLSSPPGRMPVAIGAPIPGSPGVPLHRGPCATRRRQARVCRELRRRPRCRGDGSRCRGRGRCSPGESSEERRNSGRRRRRTRQQRQ